MLKAFCITALILAGATQAIKTVQPAPKMLDRTMPYTESFRDVQTVDLDQGFYVCVYDNPQGVLDKLMAIKDQNKRFSKARELGCNFREPTGMRSIFPIAKVVEDRCLDIKNKDGHRWCGREGHEILIQREFHGVYQTVIWLSDDHDFE